jgi:L-alanine-DL-glutamate epimerase-like enolase superfamily enzyme
MSRASGLATFRVNVFAFPRDRRIGDCQVAIDTNWVGALELIDADGEVGTGFSLSLFGPLPDVVTLTEYIDTNIWPAIVGVPPETLVHRLTRPRGGNVRALLHDLDTALDQALWDLAAKRAGLPLYRYLGGTLGRVEAYASGLEYHLDDTTVRAFYAAARQDGYRAYKVKVGHPRVDWDIARLDLVRDAIGPDADLMIDANEAWTVAETRIRVHAYKAAGHRLYWVEDPILRSDFSGLAALRGSLCGARINAGEYLPTDAKMALIAADAADVVQLNSRIGDGLRIAWAAGLKGVPVALGNSHMNIGAHLAAALPEADMAEDSRLNTTDILVEPLRVVDGHIVLPDVPGHGLALAPDAIVRFGQPAAA